MEVQSTQNLSTNLNLKPSSSYVSSSSSNSLPLQQSLPPTPPSASMIQNKIESLQTSAVPTASPLNEQFNYNYHYPMYQYNQFAQAQAAPPPPPTSTQPAGYPNYNYFYQPNGQMPVAAPKNPPYFYNQQFNPNDQNNAYLNGQYNPNTQQSNTSLNDLIKHNNLINNSSPAKMDTPSKQKKSKKNDKSLNGTSNGNEDLIKKDKSPSKKNDKQKSPIGKRKQSNSKSKKKDDFNKELNNNENTNENVSPNKNDKNSKSKKKPTKKKTDIEEKESSDESVDDENDESNDDDEVDDDGDDDEDGVESNEEEEQQQIKTPKTKSPKKTNKTTPKRQISTSISSSSSSTLSDENSSEKISKLSEENTNEDSTSSSTGSLKSKNSQSSSLSFNINNILSKPQANPETQMLPPPSPSNGSTSSSTNSNNLLKHPPNVPSPSNSTSSASSSPAQTANFHKPNLNSNMQYQMWKNQSQNNQMYPQPPQPQQQQHHHQHQPMPPMFPPPNDPNFYAYHQQMITKTMSPSPMDQERPPSTKTPQINEYPNAQKLQQTPTTPQNLNLQNANQTPRSPVVNLNNSQMAMSSQHGFTTDNSNMSFTQDHDDENSMMSDEMSSPKNNNNSHQSHGGHSAKSLAHNAEVLAKLIEIGKETNDDTPERKDFVQKLQKIWEDNSIVCRSLPTVNKHLLDLYKFYCLVKARGGFSDVNKQKLWKDISSCLDMGNTAPIALILKRKYASIGLVHYECKYDLNGADPLPLIADTEKSTSKSKKQTEQNTLTSSNSNSNLSNASSMTPAKKTKKSNSKDKKDKNSTDTPPPPQPPPPPNANNTQTASPSIQFPNNQPPNNQAMMPPHVASNPQINPHFPQNEFNQQTQNQQIMNHGYPQMNPQQQQQQQQQQQYYGQPRPPYPPYQYPGQQNMMRYPMPVQQQQQQQQQPQQPTVQPPSQNPAQSLPNNQMMPPPPVQQHPQMPYPIQQPFGNQMNQPMMPYGPQVPGQQQQQPPYPQPTAQPGQHPQMGPQPQMVQQAPIPQMNPTLQRPIQEQSMSPAPPPPPQHPPQQTPNQQAQPPPPPPPQSQQNSILSSKLSNPSSSPSPLMSLNQMSQNLGPANLQPPPHLPPSSQSIPQPQPVQQQPNQQQMTPGPTMTQIPPHLHQQMRANMQPHPHPPNPQQFPGHLPQHLAHHHPPSSHLPPTQSQPQQTQQFQQQYHPQMNQNIPPQTQPQPHMPPIQPQPPQQQHPLLQQKPPHILMQQQQQQQQQQLQSQPPPNPVIQQQIQNNQIIQQAQQRIKETQFPPESIESTIPNESKKRKICAKDIGPCDPWKLYMSLKSGLLAESTWALDALNILLYDDQTISYFHLSHFPGLVNTLLEYFLKCLKILFNEFTDLEIVHYPFQHKINKENECSESDDEQQAHNDVKKFDSKKLNGFHIDSLISEKKSKKNDSQILKVNFSDKDMRNRFNHYYSNKNNKLVKYNDSRANCEWVEYNQDLLDKFNCNVNNNTNHTKKRKLRKSKSSNLDNFIQTNFNSSHEWDDLEKKLFFGDFYSHFKNDHITKDHPQLKLEMKTNKKITQPNDNPNFEFIKRHQNHIPSENNLNRKLDDQIVEDEDNLFKIVSQQNQELMNRCSIISTIIRNLSFVPGNDVELCKSTLLIDILSRLLILKHEHSLNLNDQNVDQSDDEDITGYDYLNDPIDCIKFCKEKNLIYKKKESCVSDKNVWWWECIQLLRENTLVSLANISGALNLNNLDENIIEIYSHGLIHWVICKSNEALDPLGTTSETNMLSAQRLSIEILSKLSINDINIDLISTNMVKMRPFLDSFVHVLCNEYLTKRDEQTLREFSIVLLSALAKSGQFTSRSIAKYTSSFLSFIEDFEEIARRFQLLNPNHLHYHPNFIQSSHNQNQNNPNLRLLNEDISNINEENLGTTIDMLRRCANTIAYLSVYSENGPFILKYENRILDLVTSQFVDFKVAQILSEVLFNCSKCN